MDRGSFSFTQGEPADEHTTTSQWALPPPQYQTANLYSQKLFQVETTVTKYKGDYSFKTKTDSKTGISYSTIRNII